MSVRHHFLRIVACVVICLPGVNAVRVLGQQASDATKLAIDAASLPAAAPHRPYNFQFAARNGVSPLKWSVVDGDVPAGVRLGTEGLFSGTPIVSGVFRFTVAVSDSSQPPQTAKREFTVRVRAPLLMEWKHYAKVSGNKISGSVLVSNGTEDDLDFTFIVLAVADNGRATAIGYQHFPLKARVTSFEVPFGETLPRGGYVVHLDAVAEVPAKDAIYRSRLQTRKRLEVSVGP